MPDALLDSILSTTTSFVLEAINTTLNGFNTKLIEVWMSLTPVKHREARNLGLGCRGSD